MPHDDHYALHLESIFVFRNSGCFFFFLKEKLRQYTKKEKNKLKTTACHFHYLLSKVIFNEIINTGKESA